jgi:hypothetical protein
MLNKKMLKLSRQEPPSKSNGKRPSPNNIETSQTPRPTRRPVTSDSFTANSDSDLNLYLNQFYFSFHYIIRQTYVSSRYFDKGTIYEASILHMPIF